MPRALVCTVGGLLDPVIHAVRDNAPLDHVYFLCSKDGSDQAVAGKTVRDVKGHCPHCHRDFKHQESVEPLAETAGLTAAGYDIERIDDPDELLEVVAACGRVRADVERRWPGVDVEVLANYTGGTKSMALGLGLFALREGWIPQLNKGPRKDTVRVETGDIAVVQDVSHLQADAAFERARELFDHHDYDGAASVLSATLSRLPLHRPDQQRLLELRLRSQMWAAWDRFDYPRSLELAEARQRKDHAKRLRLLIRIVEVLEGRAPWPKGRFSALPLVEDLRENAERSAARGRFDDAVGRLYRATELLAQIRLLGRYGLRTEAIPVDDPRLPEAAKQRISAPRRSDEEASGEDSVSLALVAAYQLLSDLGDPLGRFFDERRQDLLGLLEKRNRSLFAHGLVPIGERTWNEVAPKWRRWLDDAQGASEH